MSTRRNTRKTDGEKCPAEDSSSAWGRPRAMVIRGPIEGERPEAVAVETTKGSKATWFWEFREFRGGLVETRPVTAEPMSASNAEEAEDEEWIISSDDDLPVIVSKRPLPHRCPKFPWGGSGKEVSEWIKACDRVYKLAAKDPVTHPPLLTKTKGGFDTSSSSSDLYTSSSSHRQLIVGLARSIVSISSIVSDGLYSDGSPEWNFNGIVMGTSESDKRAWILTSSELVCDNDGTPTPPHNLKLLVRLPDKTIKDAQLLFFDDYYGFAVLEIFADMPLQSASFVSSPVYGDEVFVLTRKKDSSLMTTMGTVLWQNEPYFGRNHFLYLSCDLPERKSGGLVMDRDGDIAGMTFDCASPKTAVLPSFIIKKLIEMKSNFRRMACPVHGLSLRAVQFLDMSRMEEILYQHIDRGYLVDKVKINSTAELIGIRRGDVIVSINGMCPQNVLELEEYFLSLGWKFLEKKNESSKIVLKIKVYDPLKCEENTVHLPLGFSGVPAVMKRTKVTEKTSASTKRKKPTPLPMPSERATKVTEKISVSTKREKPTPLPMPSERVLRPRKKSEQ